MASFAVAGAAGLLGAAGIALKGAVEVQTYLKWDNNLLARQGESLAKKPSDADRLQRQKVGGIKRARGVTEDNGFLSKVPSKAPRGDNRAMFKTPVGTSFTNNTATIEDILARVPRKNSGTGDYKNIARPQPKPTSISNQRV